MLNSCCSTAVRACAAAALLLSLPLTPVLAHMPAGPSASAWIGGRHIAPHSFRAFNRFGFNPSRFEHFDNRRFGFNRSGLNSHASYSGYSGPVLDGAGYGGYTPSFQTAAPIIIDAAGPPVAIPVYADGDAGAGDVGAGNAVACPVLHVLNYDEAGRYVGERQVPAC